MNSIKSPLVQVHEIRKVFNQGSHLIQVLNGVNLTVYRHTFTCIIGPSGSGKTTLLQIIGGLDQPNSGYVVFEGQDIAKMNPFQRARYRLEKVGFIFQSYQLLPELTALENVMLAGRLTRRPLSVVTKDAENLLSRMGIGHRKHHRPAELSGGEQQRVAIARALMNNPQLILADEPTGNVDPVNGAMIMELLRELCDQDKKSIIMVTHNFNLVQLVDTIYQLKEGILIPVDKKEIRL